MVGVDKAVQDEVKFRESLAIILCSSRAVPPKSAIEGAERKIEML